MCASAFVLAGGLIAQLGVYRPQVLYSGQELLCVDVYVPRIKYSVYMYLCIGFCFELVGGLPSSGVYSPIAQLWGLQPLLQVFPCHRYLGQELVCVHRSLCSPHFVLAGDYPSLVFTVASSALQKAHVPRW